VRVSKAQNRTEVTVKLESIRKGDECLFCTPFRRTWDSLTARASSKHRVVHVGDRLACATFAGTTFRDDLFMFSPEIAKRCKQQGA
jgi:hypothetical protein